MTTSGFGPFQSVFEASELGVPGYLTLLHASGDDCRVVMRQIREAIGAVGSGEYVRDFLQDPNWRPHLVAAIATLLSENRASFAAFLWSAVDAGSWVAPQLVATLRATDPDFVAQAKRRILTGCPVSPPIGLSLIEHHSLTGPAGSVGRSAKNLAALLTVLDKVAGAREWVAEECTKPDVRELLAADLDASGAIAERWEETIRGHFKALGLEFPSATV